MELKTRDFGKIEIKKEDIIKFPQGIPGFVEEKEYALLPLGEDSPFMVMQAVNNSELAFITLEPGNFIKDYQFEISDNVVEKLDIADNKEVMVLAIVTMKDSLQDATINLAAPVVINVNKKLGKQVILDKEDYPVKYQLFTEKKKEMIK